MVQVYVYECCVLYVITLLYMQLSYVQPKQESNFASQEEPCTNLHMYRSTGMVIIISVQYYDLPSLQVYQSKVNNGHNDSS